MTEGEPAIATIEAGSALARISERIRQRIADAPADNTHRAFRADWTHFADWCDGHGLSALPAALETVAGYLDALATGAARATGKPYAASTIQRRIVTIGFFHRGELDCDPTKAEVVRQTWKAIRKDDEVKVRQEGREALLTPQIRQMVDALDLETDKGLRDRAVILLGFATGARRSELAALDVDDLDFRAEGLAITIRKSKADQEGKGLTPTVHYGGEYCAVRAVRGYLEAAEVDAGPVFRSCGRWGNVRDRRLSGRTVNRIVKGAAEAAGLDATGIGSHSLRSGHVTQRKISGDSNEAIRTQTGQSDSTLRRYDKRAEEFRHNVTDALGL